MVICEILNQKYNAQYVDPSIISAYLFTLNKFVWPFF